MTPGFDIVGEISQCARCCIFRIIGVVDDHQIRCNSTSDRSGNLLVEVCESKVPDFQNVLCLRRIEVLAGSFYTSCSWSSVTIIGPHVDFGGSRRSGGGWNVWLEQQ